METAHCYSFIFKASGFSHDPELRWLCFWSVLRSPRVCVELPPGSALCSDLTNTSQWRQRIKHLVKMNEWKVADEVETKTQLYWSRHENIKKEKLAGGQGGSWFQVYQVSWNTLKCSCSRGIFKTFNFRLLMETQILEAKSADPDETAPTRASLWANGSSQISSLISTQSTQTLH